MPPCPPEVPPTLIITTIIIILKTCVSPPPIPLHSARVSGPHSAFLGLGRVVSSLGPVHADQGRVATKWTLPCSRARTGTTSRTLEFLYFYY